LHGFNEGVNGLVLLLVEQKVQSLEVSLGCLAVLDAQLPEVQPGGQPAQGEGDWKPEQNPGEVKFDGAAS
jgi:hypothetical protein